MSVPPPARSVVCTRGRNFEAALIDPVTGEQRVSIMSFFEEGDERLLGHPDKIYPGQLLRIPA
jgi:hypothetical protein